MPSRLEITDEKLVYLTMTNENLTDGRGEQVVLHVCWHEETAVRLGKGKYVMGSDCPVQRAWAVKINGRWHVPARIEIENATDKLVRAANEERKRVIGKMREAGFTEEEIAAVGK